jgi:hypothetical protein
LSSMETCEVRERAWRAEAQPYGPPTPLTKVIVRGAQGACCAAARALEKGPGAW